MTRRPLFPPVFAPVVNRPMVDDFSMRAARLLQRQQPAGVQPFYPLRMRNHPMWAGNNEFGNEVSFAPDANNRQMVLKLDECGFPETWKVALGSTYFMPTDSSEYRWTVRAEVVVGSGGTVQEFYVDWMEGTVFYVVGNTVVVTAIYNDVIAVPGNEPINLRLRATLGLGHSGGATLPTVSERIIVAAGSTSTAPFIRIPPFARYMSFIDRATTAGLTSIFAATTEVNLYPTTAGATFTIGSVTGPNILAMGNRVPIPAVARAISIDNAGANDLNASVIFSIEP